jgi:hypothetical protein
MKSNSVLKISLPSVYRITIAVLASIIIYIITNTVKNLFNPDWKAYSLIFDDGAWIKEENRDPGFMLIIAFFKAVIGNQYEIFRWIISLYFTIITFFLAKGSLINYNKKHSSFLVIIIAILSFCTIRFTVQIREGIAITFLLYGLLSINKLSKNTSIGSILKCILLFFIAACIHSGTTVFFIIIIATFLLNQLSKKQFDLAKKIQKIANVSLLTFAFVVPFIYYKFLDINVLLKTERYSFDTIERELTTGKIIYWIINALCTFILIKKTKTLSNDDNNTLLKIFIDILAHSIIKPLFIIVFFFVLLSFPPLVTTSVIRLLNLTTGILLLLAAFKTKNNIFVGIFSVYTIIDQVRGVVEAYYIYNS